MLPEVSNHRQPALPQGCYEDHNILAYEVVWSYDNRTLQRQRASDLTVPHRGNLHAVTLTLLLINFILQLTAQAGKWNSSTQFAVKQRGKPVHRAQALLDINSIWRSKRGVFNFALSSFLISTIFYASCYQTEQKAELIGSNKLGKKLTSGVEAGNIILQMDTLVIPSSVIHLQKFLWASDG